MTIHFLTTTSMVLEKQYIRVPRMQSISFKNKDTSNSKKKKNEYRQAFSSIGFKHQALEERKVTSSGTYAFRRRSSEGARTTSLGRVLRLSSLNSRVEARDGNSKIV